MKKRLKIRHFLIFVFVILSGSWASAMCLPVTAVVQLQKQFHFRPELDLEQLCSPESVDYKLASTLLFLKYTKLPATTNPLDQNVLPENIWSYISSAVKTIVKVAKCEPEQLAYVKEESPGAIHLCPDYFNTAIHSSIERAATLIHEVRHLDENAHYYPHVTCAQGRNKASKGACDGSREEAGGYAVEMEALARFAALPEGIISKLERSQAKSAALVLANEKFNKPLFSHELRGLYLVDQHDQGFVLDPSSWKLYPVRKVDHRQENLVSRLTTLSAFPLSEGDSYSVDVLSSSFQKRISLGSYAASFNSLPQSQKPRVLRIFNDGLLAGFVITEHEIISYAGTSFEQRTALPFKVIQTFDFMEAGQGTDAAIFLLDEHQNLYKVSTIYGRVVDVKTIDNVLKDFKTIVYVNGQRLALGKNGELLIQRHGIWHQHEAFLKTRFRLMSRPFYWASFLFEPRQTSQNSK
ncbi:M35 family metallo-endopeptidase [Bdellovibrio bacteriovorus]|nr:M35 family metallo-endopeptidase [Bdellovibrio bacteriovorus]